MGVLDGSRLAKQQTTLPSECPWSAFFVLRACCVYAININIDVDIVMHAFYFIRLRVSFVLSLRPTIIPIISSALFFLSFFLFVVFALFFVFILSLSSLELCIHCIINNICSSSDIFLSSKPCIGFATVYNTGYMIEVPERLLCE